MIKLFGVVFLLILTVGCKQYSFTFNDTTLYEPPTLFTNYSVVDRTLNECLAQTISELKVYKAEDLKIVRCTHAGITRIDGLSTFTHITVLDLSYNNLKYVPELAELSQLSQLNLHGNKELSCDTVAKLIGRIELILPAHCNK